MDLSVGIAGIKARVEKDCLIIQSETPLRVLSSAILNGGHQKSKNIINFHVSKDYNHQNPSHYLEKQAETRNLSPQETIGLMTAVSMESLVTATHNDKAPTITVFITAGVSNPATAGDKIQDALNALSTINTIVVVDGNLTEACLVNAVMTATEAKAAALAGLDIRSPYSRNFATGTTSDATVIACTGRGTPISYAGTATELGERIGTLVRGTVQAGLQKSENLFAHRPLLLRLKERGISLEELVATALELFSPHPGVETREIATKLLKEGFDEVFSDINLTALVLAGFRLEEDGYQSLIPEFPREQFIKDSVILVADECLGLTIANYIAGTRGIFEYTRFDQKKPGILKRLGPVMDDIIAALVAGVSSQMYTRAASREDQ